MIFYHSSLVKLELSYMIINFTLDLHLTDLVILAALFLFAAVSLLKTLVKYLARNTDNRDTGRPGQVQGRCEK